MVTPEGGRGGGAGGRGPWWGHSHSSQAEQALLCAAQITAKLILYFRITEAKRSNCYYHKEMRVM